MTDTPTKTAPTNQEVARALGLSHSGVSRLRTGDRLPSLATMQRIETEYGWSVQGQSTAISRGRWSDAFREVLRGDPESGAPAA